MYTNPSHTVYSATPGHVIQMPRSPYSSFAITPITQTQQAQGFTMAAANTQNQAAQAQYAAYQAAGGQAYHGSQSPPSQY